MSKYSDDSSEIINDMHAEIAALKLIVTQLLNDKSDEDLKRYKREVSLNSVHEIAVPDEQNKQVITGKAQKISRSLVSAIIDSRK